MSNKNINAEKIQGNLSINSVSATTFYGGQLTITGNTTLQSNLYLTNLQASTEHVLIQSASTSQVSYIQTDSQFIVDSTLITALLNAGNWSAGNYSGTITGAVEGQMYVGSSYLYIFNNSTFKRYASS